MSFKVEVLIDKCEQNKMYVKTLECVTHIRDFVKIQ
jgi:hypothetical protein